jgi:hypothetical protein
VQPQVDWNETDAAANNRRWRLETQAEQFLGRTVNDANSAAVTWLAVDRTLNAVDSIALTSTALTWNGNPLLSTTTAFANPTGTVGLAAVNGAATTALRSDAAPPLSQAIAPSWSAQHTWTGNGTDAVPNILLSNTQPTFIFNQTGGAVDNRRWEFSAQVEQFVANTLNDAANSGVVWLRVDRTGTTVDTITWPAGGHIWSAAGTNAIPNILLSNTLPVFTLNETDAAADNRRWVMLVNGEQLRWSLINDANSIQTDFLTVDRTGTTVDLVNIPTPLLQAQGIHNGTAPTGTNNYIASGTYTPTGTSVSNIGTLTPNSAQWTRVGNVVTVAGSVGIDPTAASAATVFDLSLPIASNLANLNELGGSGTSEGSATVAVVIRANTANDRSQFVYIAVDATAQNLYYIYSYRVL